MRIRSRVEFNGYPPALENATCAQGSSRLDLVMDWEGPHDPLDSLWKKSMAVRFETEVACERS